MLKDKYYLEEFRKKSPLYIDLILLIRAGNQIILVSFFAIVYQ